MQSFCGRGTNVGAGPVRAARALMSLRIRKRAMAVGGREIQPRILPAGSRLRGCASRASRLNRDAVVETDGQDLRVQELVRGGWRLDVPANRCLQCRATGAKPISKDGIGSGA